MIKVCVAGVTGWTGSAVARAVAADKEFKLVGAVARKCAGMDVGEALGMEALGVKIDNELEAALERPTDVVIEYTHAASAKKHVMTALNKGIRVVVGSSGLTATDFEEIEKIAKSKGIGVIAAGNFSITAALAKRFALMAAEYLPTWEIIDFADPHKPDAPSGTAREMADQMAQVKHNEVVVPIDSIVGQNEARGATVSGAQLHSVRLPGYTFGFETLFGLPDERLTIKHDSGTSASPYVQGTLLAARRVMETTGLVRGMDRLL